MNLSVKPYVLHFCHINYVLQSHIGQKFDFGFEEEDSIEGMKKLIVQEVNEFRAEVRAQARAAGQGRRQDSLPIPSRDEIINSPVSDPHGATSGFTTGYANPQRVPSPVMDNPSDALEKELAGTHIAGRN